MAYNYSGALANRSVKLFQEQRKMNASFFFRSKLGIFLAGFLSMNAKKRLANGIKVDIFVIVSTLSIAYSAVNQVIQLPYRLTSTT